MPAFRWNPDLQFDTVHYPFVQATVAEFAMELQFTAWLEFVGAQADVLVAVHPVASPFR